MPTSKNTVTLTEDERDFLLDRVLWPLKTVEIDLRVAKDHGSKEAQKYHQEVYDFYANLYKKLGGEP